MNQSEPPRTYFYHDMIYLYHTLTPHEPYFILHNIFSPHCPTYHFLFLNTMFFSPQHSLTNDQSLYNYISLDIFIACRPFWWNLGRTMKFKFSINFQDLENYGKVVRILPLLQNICLHCFISFWLKSWEWKHVTIFNVHTTIMKVMFYPIQYTPYFIIMWYNNSKQNCKHMIEVLAIWTLA